ncbi:hypothetical protein F4677DRAFT_255718 [Hypoxylon crocopeplum]|nr:hypothetical protein F4677DRAFT_255718 [Hypoxylon crocopeplum]
MSSLFEQAEANSTDKPVLTKYGHAAPGEGSGMDENPNSRSTTQTKGSQKTGAGGAQAIDRALMTPASETKLGTPNIKKVQNGIEYFQP